jgi:hypothetical protein
MQHGATTLAAEPPFGVPNAPFTQGADQRVTTEMDATAHLEQRLATMRAHAIRIAMDGELFALSNNTRKT